MSNSRFLTTLCVERVKVGGKLYRLTSDLAYASDLLDRILIVPAGFVTDFGSVPRWPLTYWLFGGVGDEAAVLHDFLYEWGIVSRETADNLFAEACAVCEVPAWRWRPMWAAVRVFGGKRYSLPTPIEAKVPAVVPVPSLPRAPGVSDQPA